VLGVEHSPQSRLLDVNDRYMPTESRGLADAGELIEAEAGPMDEDR
jgi:hypothetical protein